MNLIKRLTGLAVAASLALPAAVHAQYLMVVDSGRGKVFLCDPQDGSVINDDFIVQIPNGPYDFGTIKEAIQVGDEIWLSDQTRNVVWRFTATLTPNYIGQISGNMSNIRGLGRIGSKVFVSNANASGASPANSIPEFDLAGNFQGAIATGGTSPFDVEPFQGGFLVSHSSGTNDITRHDADGLFLNVFHAGSIAFAQQLHVANTGPMGEPEVWAAGFSSPSGLYRYDASGTQVGFYSVVAGLRGCWVLGDGTVLVTSSGTLNKVDPATNTSTIVPVPTGASLHYINFLTPTATPPPTPLFVAPSASSDVVIAGQNVTFQALAVPATGPASTGIAVTADLSAFGGSFNQPLNDDGNNQFSFQFAMPASQFPSSYIVTFTVTDAEMRSASADVTIIVIEPPPMGFVVESENNSTKDLANDVNVAPGGGIYGYSSGTLTTTGAAGSADYFIVNTPPAAPGIYRHRLIIDTDTPGHTGTIRGLSQSAGIINTSSDAIVQTSSATSSPPRFNQWYGFTDGSRIYYRISGSASTTAPYRVTLETDPVTPIDAGTVLEPGSITISRSGVTTAVDILVYDADFEAVADFLNDGTAAGFTRTYTPGTYYVAISNANTADDRPAPADSATRSNPVMDFPGAVANSMTALMTTLAVRFIDSASNDVVVPAPKTGPFDVSWVKFVVGGAPIPCPGDYNDDGVVDLADLLDFLGDWNPSLGQSVTPGTNGDINGDGVVDLADLLDFLGDWNPNLGSACP
ncbi:MAG: hypothetical protein KF768_10760 [Phycisphaeraceae bacterium]|nr:hypothetical protein [Phycisphaeraceae bacterium]